MTMKLDDHGHKPVVLSDDEIAFVREQDALHPDITPNPPVCKVLGWRIDTRLHAMIYINHPTHGSGVGEIKSTPIVWRDTGRGLVRTRNTLYKLLY